MPHASNDSRRKNEIRYARTACLVALASFSIACSSPHRTVGYGEGGAIPTASAGPTVSHVVTRKGDRLLWDGVPTSFYGIRVASASQTPELTDQLLGQLDAYRAQGVNAFSVFYQGSSGLASDPFSADGKTLDAGVERRTHAIIEAANARGMLVIAGVLYDQIPQQQTHLKDWQATGEAMRTVVRSLSPYRNVILDLVNIQSSPFHPAAWQKILQPSAVQELLDIVHSEDAMRLVGTGGFDDNANRSLGPLTGFDVLLMQGGEIGTRHDTLRQAGITQPILVIELYGGTYTCQFLPPGTFPADVRQRYFSDLDAAVARPGLGVFFHSSPWTQGPGCGNLPIRYELGGQGTNADPGILWYFEYLASRIK